MGDPVALVLALDDRLAERRWTPGSRRAGRAAAARSRCTLRPDSSNSSSSRWRRLRRRMRHRTLRAGAPMRDRVHSLSRAVHEAVTAGAPRARAPSDAMSTPRERPVGRRRWRSGPASARPSRRVARSPLSVRELELLEALARRQGRIVPRDELYETVWGGAAAGGRPLGRRLRPQAAREARRRAAGAGSTSTRTSASATGSRPSVHTLFTTRPQLRNRLGLRPLRVSNIYENPSPPDRPLLALALAGGVAACGSDDEAELERRRLRRAPEATSRAASPSTAPRPSTRSPRRRPSSSTRTTPT